MFQQNDEHVQSDMFSTAMQLPEKRRQRLVQSWAGTFYRDFFCRIDESIFAGLYSDRPSRPNVPVNVLVGFEVLKAGHGWSDEQAYDAVCFDVQVRYALGLHHLTDDDFTLRTVYNFRRAVAEHAGRVRREPPRGSLRTSYRRAAEGVRDRLEEASDGQHAGGEQHPEHEPPAAAR